MMFKYLCFLFLLCMGNIMYGSEGLGKCHQAQVGMREVFGKYTIVYDKITDESDERRVKAGKVNNIKCRKYERVLKGVILDEMWEFDFVRDSGVVWQASSKDCIEVIVDSIEQFRANNEPIKMRQVSRC